MSKNTLAISWSTTIFVILIVQLITVGMLGASLLTLGAGSVASISQIPPINFLYNNADLEWVGSGRVIAHVVTMLANVMIAFWCVWYGISRRLKIIKYITIALGVHLAISAVVNSTLIGLVTVGGWWHVAAFIASALMAVVAAATVVIITLLAHKLKHLGIAHDHYIGTQANL